MEVTKRCLKCKVEKSLGGFNKHGGNADGLNYWCRLCTTKYNRRWRVQNPEYSKHRYANSQAAGLCSKCQKPSWGGITLCKHHLWRSHLRGVRVTGRFSEISEDTFLRGLDELCTYCGINQSTGWDRAKNEYGYTKLNSVPCCKSCNFLKGRLTVKAFIIAVNPVARYCPDYPAFKNRWNKIREELFECRSTNSNAVVANEPTNFGSTTTKLQDSTVSAENS
jgi:hypothetical protein